MKKILFFVVMMFTLSMASAQSLDGVWKADKETISQMGIEDEGLKLDLFCVFRANKIEVSFNVKGQMDGVDIEISAKIPGTFTRNGNSLDLEFDPKAATMELEKLKLSSELETMLDSAPAGTKEALINEIKNSVNAEDLLGGAKEISDALSNASLQIKSLTDKKLVLASEGQSVAFDRLVENKFK